MPDRSREVEVRLARIERRLDEVYAALDALRSGVEAPPVRRFDALRALGRLGVAVWAAGLLALAAGAWIAGIEAGQSPLANVCASPDAAAYDECLREPDGSERGTWLASLRRQVLGAEVASERVVQRTETERYRTSLRRVIGVAVGWTVAVLASVAVVIWVGRGLRPRPRARR